MLNTTRILIPGPEIHEKTVSNKWYVLKIHRGLQNKIRVTYTNKRWCYTLCRLFTAPESLSEYKGINK